jgi:hypothetical protein
MLSLFWRRLAAGGLLMAGNFTPDHPTRSYMEWVGNWYLIYRTRDELHRIADHADIPLTGRQVVAERSGIDWFVWAAR